MTNLYFLKNIVNGETIELIKSPFTIGRNLSSDYVIANRVISKSQCVLKKTNEGWVLSDTSTNGTMVNKEILKQSSVVLKNSDEICFGFHTFTYKFVISPNQPKCHQIEKLINQEKNAKYSPPNSPNSFDELGVSDEVLNALTDELLENIETQDNISPKEKTNDCNTPSDMKQPLSTCSVPTSEILTSLKNSSESHLPISKDPTSSESLNLNKILDPVGLLMKSTSTSNTNIETLEITKDKPPDTIDRTISQSSDETVTYSPSEIPSVQKFEDDSKKIADVSSQETKLLRNEISMALNLIADKTPDLVDPVSAVASNSNTTVNDFKADCLQNLVDIANKYSAEINSFVSKSSEVSATSLLMQIANNVCATSLPNSDTGSSKVTSSNTSNPGTSLINKQLKPIVSTKEIISPVNPNKKLKISYDSGSSKNTAQQIQSTDLGSTSELVSCCSRNIQHNSKLTEGTSLPQNDIIDLTCTQDTVTNKASNKLSSKNPYSKGVLKPHMGDNPKIFGSSALPVANNEIVSTSNPSITVTPDCCSLPRSAQKATSAKRNILQEPGQNSVANLPSDKKEKSNKNSYEEMENELLCSICANLFIKTMTLNCSHSFCQYCIEQWKKKKSDCPVCRTKISSSIRTLVLDNIIEKMIESASADERTQRKEAVQERENIEKAEKEAQERAQRPQSARRGRRGGQNRNTNNSRNNNNRQQPPAPVVEVSDESSSSASSSSTELSDSSDSDLTQSEYDYDEYEDDDWYSNEDDYNGLPGAYYGGYGRCYRCGDPGHWANGCPN
ncbi:myb-like protein U [Anthonomus grandis grandis]|uniref:myb-like protein U n=1 Tax=Anthonomus grandis grandis TaxID=2921223 RepID=UPI0021658EB8|nr:myb-like protein U [Anthonomus grandis grandis]